MSDRHEDRKVLQEMDLSGARPVEPLELSNTSLGRQGENLGKWVDATYEALYAASPPPAAMS